MNHKQVRAKKVVFHENVSQEFESEKRCLASKVSLTRIFFWELPLRPKQKVKAWERGYLLLRSDRAE